MAGNTVIAGGSPAANKIFNAALFSEAMRRNSLTNMLTGEAPRAVNKSKVDPRKQTEQGAPIVRITDLSKEMGDEVTTDLYHHLTGLATMGDDELEGRVESLSSSQFTLRIDQGRKAVSSGGRMTKQRTQHDLIQIAKSMIGPWWAARDDQLSCIHLCGARGEDETADWRIPLENHPEFARQAVNDLLPPTYDRYLTGGDSTSLQTIDSADKFTLAEVDKIRLFLDEMAYPPQPIQYEKDPLSQESPFYVLLVSPRQWNDFWTSTSGADWREIITEANNRRRDFNHPVFAGEVAMWSGILIRKMSRPISFKAGSAVNVSANDRDATVTQETAGVPIHRALLCGAQALACAYGRQGKKEEGGMYFGMHTEYKDHYNKQEHSICWINGKKKIRFRGTDGRVNDFGTIALDTAVSAG